MVTDQGGALLTCSVATTLIRTVKIRSVPWFCAAFESHAHHSRVLVGISLPILPGVIALSVPAHCRDRTELGKANPRLSCPNLQQQQQQ